MDEKTQAIEQVINSTPWLKQYFVHMPTRIGFLEPMATLKIENCIPGIQNAAISVISVYFGSPVLVPLSIRQAMHHQLETS